LNFPTVKIFGSTFESVASIP